VNEGAFLPTSIMSPGTTFARLEPMRVLFAFALAVASTSCAARAPAGPAWPRSADREVDGGETLAPRTAARAIAAIVEDDRAADRSAADKPAAAPSAPASGPAPATSAPTPEDLNLEEIVIEVDEASP
jgi:hypothetical protein